MNRQKLGQVLYTLSKRIRKDREGDVDLEDAAHAIQALVHLLEGKPLHKAFGAPGDWGYDTEIGKALVAREEAHSGNVE